MATAWVLTDTRYLGQRMPAALIDQLAVRGVRTRVLVADDLVVEAAPTPGIQDPWAELQDGDVVVARTRNRFGLSLLPAAERRGVTAGLYRLTERLLDGIDHARLARLRWLMFASEPMPPARTGTPRTSMMRSKMRTWATMRPSTSATRAWRQRKVESRSVCATKRSSGASKAASRTS